MGTAWVWVGSQVPSLSTYVPTRQCEHSIVWTHNELQDPVTGVSGKTVPEYKGLKSVIWTLCQKLLKK